MQILRIKQLTQRRDRNHNFSLLFSAVFYFILLMLFYYFLRFLSWQKENVTAMPKRNGRSACSVDCAKCRLSYVLLVDKAQFPRPLAGFSPGLKNFLEWPRVNGRLKKSTKVASTRLAGLF